METIQKIDNINEEWFDCKISDDERLTRIEKTIPDKFRKQEFYDLVASAKKEVEKVKVPLNLNKTKSEPKLSPEPQQPAKQQSLTVTAPTAPQGNK